MINRRMIQGLLAISATVVAGVFGYRALKVETEPEIELPVYTETLQEANVAEEILKAVDESVTEEAES